MKRTALFLFLFLSVTLQAQQTLPIPYQALVRDASGNPLPNKQIGANISLLLDNINGTEIFTEIHNPTTNPFGQLDVQIGSVETAAFDAIDWSAGKMFIKLEVDITGGTNYQPIATHQLLAVPFAKYAEEAAGLINLNDSISEFSKRHFKLSENNFFTVDPSDQFNYQGNWMTHYGIGWFRDPWHYERTAYLSSRAGIKFFTHTAPQMVIDFDGNVGIGTTDPTSKIDIQTAIPVEGTYQTQKWSVSNGGYNLKLVTIWDAGGINQRFVQRFSGTEYDVLAFFQGSCYTYNLKTSSLGIETYLKMREPQKFKTLPQNDITDVKSIIEQDTILDFGKMDIFLLKKIDNLIQYNIQLQKNIEAQQKEIEAQNLRFEKLEAEIENIKNK